MTKQGKIYIGTSGWVYRHWSQVFYPENLSQRDWLKFYTRHFDTVELNASFYHLPKPKTFANWGKTTPRDFLFAVKASRFITHIKKLGACQEPWQRFIRGAQELKEKLGPILFQLPPSLKSDPVKLESFLKILSKKYQYTLEARNSSWFQDKIYKILKKYKVALCIADSPHYPKEEVVTTDFVYLRFHGGRILYGSNYSHQELRTWAKKIKIWLKDGLRVYAYFNNDAQGYAVANALSLKKLVDSFSVHS